MGLLCKYIKIQLYHKIFFPFLKACTHWHSPFWSSNGVKISPCSHCTCLFRVTKGGSFLETLTPHLVFFFYYVVTFKHSYVYFSQEGPPTAWEMRNFYLWANCTLWLFGPVHWAPLKYISYQWRLNRWKGPFVDKGHAKHEPHQIILALDFFNSF